MEEAVKQLNILHRALVMGAFFIVLVNGLVLQPVQETDFNFQYDLFSVIGLGLGLFSLLGSYLIFQRKLDMLGKQKITLESMQDFRAAYVGKWSLLEFGVLSNTLLYFLGGNKLLISMAVLLLVLLYLSKPKFIITHVS